MWLHHPKLCGIFWFDLPASWLACLVTCLPRDLSVSWLAVSSLTCLVTCLPHDSRALWLACLVTHLPHDSPASWFACLVTPISPALLLTCFVTHVPHDSTVSCCDLSALWLTAISWQTSISGISKSMTAYDTRVHVWLIIFIGKWCVYNEGLAGLSSIYALQHMLGNMESIVLFCQQLVNKSSWAGGEVYECKLHLFVDTDMYWYWQSCMATEPWCRFIFSFIIIFLYAFMKRIVTHL